MPGNKYNSIQNPAMYRALRRRRGMSKEQAARISNARTPGHTVNKAGATLRFEPAQAVEICPDCGKPLTGDDPCQHQFAGYTMEDWDDTKPDSFYHATKASAGVAPLAIAPHGPNALLNNFGIERSSVRSRRRKKRTTKATRITGNLFRGEAGKFQAGPGGSSSAKPSAEEELEKPGVEKPDRDRDRDAALAKEEETRAAEDAAVEAEPSAKKRQAMRRQNAANRRVRAAERRTQEREARAADRQARETEAGAKKLAADQARQAKLDEQGKKPKGGGGGGGSAKPAKPTDEEKRSANLQKRTQTARDTAKAVGLPDGASDLLTAARDSGGVSDPRLVNMGLVGSDGLATDQGRRALGALERGDVGGYRAAVQDAQKRLEREAQAQVRGQERDRRQAERDARDAERDAEDQKREEARSRRDAPVPGARRRSRRYQQYLVRQGLQRRKEAAFVVFKDAQGRDWWGAITTSAYQDKDEEWVTCKAIGAVADAGPVGPLRYWHVPGLDFGDCAFVASAFDDRVLIEAGPFRSKAAARIAQEAARRGYEMSPGFVHSRKEPRNGAFEHIVIFERSFVPPGRASNPYTRLLTKETRMLTDEKKKEFESLAGDDTGRAFLAQLLNQAETTVKQADAAGAIYKEAPAWAQDLARRIGALETTTKAPMPPGEMIDAGDTEMLDGELESGDELADTPAADVADELMSDDAFADLVAQKVIALLGPQLDLESKMAKWAGEIKSAIPAAVAQKDDERAKQLTEIDTRLKELEGGQPRSFRAQAWHDLTGQIVTKEQAAAITTKTPQEIPADLNPQEQGAYALIFGNE